MKILIINCSPVRDGATQRIVDIVSDNLSSSNTIKKVCIDDYDIKLCKGCRKCHKTAKCFQNDDVDKLMAEYEWADKIVSVSPCKEIIGLLNFTGTLCFSRVTTFMSK